MSGPRDAPPTPPSAPAPRWRAWAPHVLRLVVLTAIGLWLWRGANLASLGAALARIPVGALGLALAIAFLNMGVAALRWRTLMRAFGARPLPGLALLFRLILVGLFYNTYVPGSVGGDLVRGVVSRRNFRTAAASYVVVALERLVGLSALGLVFLAGLALAPEIVDWAAVAPWIGALVAGGVALLIVARATGRLASWWGQVPRVERWSDLLLAFGISFIGHGLNIAIFALFAGAMGLPVSAAALVVVVPLAMVAAVVPIALAGIGPREAALVGLLGILGVARAEALALSLGYAMVLLVLAGSGGLLQLLGVGLRLEPDTTQSSAASPPGG